MAPSAESPIHKIQQWPLSEGSHNLEGQSEVHGYGVPLQCSMGYRMAGPDAGCYIRGCFKKHETFGVTVLCPLFCRTKNEKSVPYLRQQHRYMMCAAAITAARCLRAADPSVMIPVTRGFCVFCSEAVSLDNSFCCKRSGNSMPALSRR